MTRDILAIIAYKWTAPKWVLHKKKNNSILIYIDSGNNNLENRLKLKIIAEKQSAQKYKLIADNKEIFNFVNEGIETDPYKLYFTLTRRCREQLENEQLLNNTKL